MNPVGCLMLFLLPFAAVGVFAGVQVVRAALMHDWAHAGFYAIFALTFGGVGFGGIAAALAGKKKLAAQEALKAGHPDAPWLWRADWAARRADDATRQTVWFAWVFATFWNLIAIPSGFLGVREALQKGNHAALIALLFPLVGIGLLAWAIRATARYRRYGVSRFELTTLPGVIGHSLVGTRAVVRGAAPRGRLPRHPLLSPAIHDGKRRRPQHLGVDLLAGGPANTRRRRHDSNRVRDPRGRASLRRPQCR